MRIQNIFAFGDSITYGARDKELGGWAMRLRAYFNKKSDSIAGPKYYFYDLGISGETTEGALKRFAQETQVRADPDEENFFIIAYGANDSAVLPKEGGRFSVTLDQFKDNLKTLLAQAKEFSGRVLLINITPVIDSVTSNKEFRSRLNEYVAKYNEVIKSLANDTDVFLLDINSVFVESGAEELLSEDGLHPNSKGHTVMFETIRSALEKLV